jgi:PKHD-type hydroxylase
MKAMWQMWEGKIADATCDEIVRYAQLLPAHKGYVGHEDWYDSKEPPPSDIRDTTVRWIEHDNEDFKPVWDLMWRHIQHANANAFGLDLDFARSVQFCEYHAERLSHYTWHSDVFWETDRPYQRKLTAILQLSDPASYEGGDLVLDYYRPPCPVRLRERGTIFVFPSFVHHKVEPITRGTRYSLVMWAEGPCWK